MYNTITQQNDYDWRKGLAAAKKAEAAFHSAPSIINNITLAESTPQAAYEALADEQMYNGAGVRRYDGTWSTPEEALDDDIFGDDMMRISYANGEFDAKKYDLKNSLGWLADRDENLKNYIDAVHSENPDSKQV